jgi:cell division control protein 24
LGELLDFQRRFLFSLEATLVLKADEQDIGSIFIQYEEGFYVYESMCANYSNAINVVLANQTALASVGSIDPIRELQGLLIQPVQRICRYPMILKVQSF